MKKFIDMLRSRNERIDDNIFTSLHNVNIDALPGYRKNGTKHSFLENYKKNKGE